MADVAHLKHIGTAAVKRLRKQELAAGFSFMINSEDLPSKQSYMEYPDGSMSIVIVAPNEPPFTVIRELSAAEAQAVRDSNDLQ